MRNADPLCRANTRLPSREEVRFISGRRTGRLLCCDEWLRGLEMSAQSLQFQAWRRSCHPQPHFSASAYPFIKHGARLVWADIDPLPALSRPRPSRKPSRPKQGPSCPWIFTAMWPICPTSWTCAGKGPDLRGRRGRRPARCRN